MSFLKYINRLKRLDDLIRRNATGNATELAKKIGISRSQLFQHLKEMREIGAPISYSPIKRSYYYSHDCRFIIDFVCRDSRNNSSITNRHSNLHKN